MPNHVDSVAHKGAVEGQTPNEPNRSGHSNLADQLPHRSSNDSMIKNRDEDNDTDFPEPGRTPEHSGQSE
jgi:hypothetical protein